MKNELDLLPPLLSNGALLPDLFSSRPGVTFPLIISRKTFSDLPFFVSNLMS